MLINVFPLFFIDPYNPWSTHTDSFRINNINHREFSITSNDHPYKVIASTNTAQSHLVDMEVIDASTNESIKTFTAVDSHFDKDGLMVSSIDSKTLKSNVVLHDQDVVVFDEVKNSRHCLFVYIDTHFFYSSLAVLHSSCQHQIIFWVVAIA